MKEISRNEKEFLINNGYIKTYTYDSPVCDNNGNFLYTTSKTVYRDLTITNKDKSSKQKYYTRDDLVDNLRSGKLK